MVRLSIIAAVLAVALMVGLALYVAPRLRRGDRGRRSARALTVLFSGLLVAGALVALAIALRLVEG